MGQKSFDFDNHRMRHTYAFMRTTMNLAPDVRGILRRESARRHATMTALLEAAVRSVYGSKRGRPSPRRLVRKNGYLVVAALPGERPITDARVREIIQEMEW